MTRISIILSVIFGLLSDLLSWLAFLVFGWCGRGVYYIPKLNDYDVEFIVQREWIHLNQWPLFIIRQ